MRALGYWLLYATVGFLILLMAIAGGGDMGEEDPRSPVRHGTKILGAVNGMMLAITALGLYLLGDPDAVKIWPRVMVGVGGPLAAILSIWTYARIVSDLRRRRR